MSKKKKLFWIVLGTFVAALLLAVIYGMGRDIVSVIPQWLTECAVGLCALALGAVICFVFAMGIIKIKEIGKGED